MLRLEYQHARKYELGSTDVLLARCTGAYERSGGGLFTSTFNVCEMEKNIKKTCHSNGRHLFGVLRDVQKFSR